MMTNAQRERAFMRMRSTPRRLGRPDARGGPLLGRHIPGQGRSRSFGQQRVTRCP